MSYCMLMTVQVNETIEVLRNKFSKWKRAFETKGSKDNLGKIKVMVGSGIMQNGLSKGEVDPCGVCSLKVRANSVLCVLCVRWIHCRRA